MNKVYKVIWNAATGSWTAVSELGKSKTKTKSVTLAVAGALAIAAGSAQAANIVEGDGAVAKAGDNSIVLGNGASVGQGQSVAIGNQATTVLNDAVAIGTNSQAISYGDIAIGLNAKAEHSAPENQITSRQGAIAIGVSANATNLNSVSIGNYADASAWGATAFGNNATADGTNATALGKGATATGGTGSIAAGTDAIADGQGTSALGSNANASALNAAALGYATTANGSMSTAVGSNAVSSGTQSTSVGAWSKAEGNFSSATGTFANASGDRATANGPGAKATGDRTVATGYNANASGANSTAVGTLSKADGENTTTVGSLNNVTANQSTAVGTNNTVTADGSAAIGTNNTVTAKDAFVFGSNITDPHANSIILGANSSAAGYTQAPDTEVGAVDGEGGYTYDASKYAGNAGLEKGDYLSIGSKGNERQLKHLAAGEISATSTDGVNGSQLYAVMDRVESLVRTGFNIGENNTAGDVNQEGNTANSTSVGLSNNIDFNNGHLTVARVEVVPSADGKQNDAKVYYDVVTQALSNTTTDGKAAVSTDPAQSNGKPLDATNPDALTTAQNVADAINASGWVTTNTDGTTAVVNPGDKVNFANGTGTVANVVTEGDTTTVKFDLKADSKTVKVDPTTGEIQAVTSPITQTGSPANGDQKSSTDTPDALATAGDVVNAVNSARETVTSEDNTVEVVKSANDLGGTNYDLSVKIDSKTITNGDNGLEVATSPITQSGTAAAGDQKSSTDTPDALATAGDVVNAVNSARETVTSNDKSVEVVKSANTLGGTNYDLSVKVDSNTITKDTDGKLQVATGDVTTDTTTGKVNPADTTNGPIAKAEDVVNAINNSGWKVQGNGEGDEIVNPGDTVNFANGTGTVANVETKDGVTTVKYDLNVDSKTVKVDPTSGEIQAVTSPITQTGSAADGTQKSETTDPDAIAKAGDVVNAVNSARETVTSNDKSVEVVKSANTLGGTNYDLSVKVDSTTITKGEDGKLEVATGDITVDPTTGKVNPADTTNGTIATVGDVVNAINNSGWTVQGNGEGDEIVNPGDKVNFANGTGTVANVETKDGVTTVKYDLNVDSKTVKVGDDGKVTVITAPITQTGSAADGTQKSETTDPDAIAKAGDVVNAVNSARETVTSSNETVTIVKSENEFGGTNYDLAVNLVNGVNTKVVKVTKEDGTTTYQIDANKDLVDINSIQLNGPKGADGENGKDGATLATAQGPAGVDGKDGETKTRIVYQPLDENGQPKGEPEQVATLNDGMKFVGDDGQVVVKKLNETLSVKGNSGNKELTEGNIGVVADGKGGLTVKLAKDVDLGEKGSVKAGTVNVAGSNGANVAMTSNKGPSFNTAGKADGGTVNVLNVGTAANPTRINGVANGEISATSRDAINGSQLHGAVTNINNRIDDLDQNRKAGAASAMAAAGLPQAYREGQSGVVAALGQYQGETGVAVGFTSISDNGKWLFRGAYATNTQNEHSGNLGLGYFW